MVRIYGHTIGWVFEGKMFLFVGSGRVKFSLTDGLEEKISLNGQIIHYVMGGWSIFSEIGNFFVDPPHFWRTSTLTARTSIRCRAAFPKYRISVQFLYSEATNFPPGGGGYSGIFAYGYDDSCDSEIHPLRNIWIPKTHPLRNIFSCKTHPLRNIFPKSDPLRNIIVIRSMLFV